MTPARRILATVLALLCAHALGSSVAVTRAATAVDAPASVALGETDVPVTLTISNDTGGTEIVCNADYSQCEGASITLLPACRTAVEDCAAPDREPSVFTASPNAVGRIGTACAGTVFFVTIADDQSGLLRLFPPPGQVILPTAGSQCRIDLALSVTGMPRMDAQPATPGLQTFQVVSASKLNSDFGMLGRSSGSRVITVDPATPSLTATASADLALNTGTLTDTASVSGRVSPLAGATVKFSLFGPGDATCASAIFTSTRQLSAADTTTTSEPFTPRSTGIHRWIASYSGDANNARVSTACDDPVQRVVVGAAPGFELLDRDNDGVSDAADNCPDTANADQRDSDRDDIGDACENSEASTGPTLKETAVLRAERGTVLVRPPANARFRTLRGAELLPLGTVVDSRRGKLALSSSTPTAAGLVTQRIELSGAIFRIRQNAAARRPYTDLDLRIPSGAPSCTRRSTAQAAKVSPARAQLMASGRGRFRVRGRRSRSTARGTVWTTEERCSGTVTRVSRGRVNVADKGTGKIVSVAAGKSYVARNR